VKNLRRQHFSDTDDKLLQINLKQMQKLWTDKQKIAEIIRKLLQLKMDLKTMYFDRWRLQIYSW
jgi:hypothetical protein